MGLYVKDAHMLSPWLPKGIDKKLRSKLVTWLSVSTFGVASLIVLGGVTRLTRSGLSMTEWKFTGERPPFNDRDWEVEFMKYKQSPEFQKVNKSITNEEFKFIYWVEYGHRMWGRCLGIVFGVPALYFIAKGAVTRHLGKNLALLFLMGGTQGLIGWWMVKSGLEKPKEETHIPRVSPYRLATHLTSAFAIYALLLWTTFSIKSPTPLLRTASQHIQKNAEQIRSWVLPLGGLIATTAISGAFVAGNDAGHSYNTFPKMLDSWIPEEYFSTKLFSAEHIFENTAAVQLHHRVLALTSATACILTFLAGRRLDLLPSTQRYLHALAGMAVLQVTLGVTALLHYVPVWLGSAHQAGALVLFSVLLGLLHSLRPGDASLWNRTLSRMGPGITAAGVCALGVLVTQRNGS